MFKRQKKVVVEVTNHELRMILESLLDLRNRLVREGRYTDPVEEMLAKLLA